MVSCTEMGKRKKDFSVDRRDEQKLLCTPQCGNSKGNGDPWSQDEEHGGEVDRLKSETEK